MIRLSFFLLLISSLVAQIPDLTTYYEKSNYKATPRYNETVEYCKKLADASPFIKYMSFGKSPQGRELPLLIVDKNANFTSAEVRQTDNVVFFIQAGIHSGEIDGKDAGFMLLRDIITKKEFINLLDHVTILFNPIFNVDGHERFSEYSRANQNGPEEMGWRVTAQNLNLNRDYLKADAPEMQHWLNLYTDWLPEFFADCHVTDGADYQYVITYKMEQHGILDHELINWIEQNYLPLLRQSMAGDGFPLSEYVSFRQSHNLESGMTTWATPPRFSDGYTAIHNRPGLLIETHMFKDYKSRVSSTYYILKNTIELLNKEYQNLKFKIAEADRRTSSSAFREKPYTINYKYTNQSELIEFLGYEYEVVKSDLTGGNWYRFYTDKPKTYEVQFFNKMEPNLKIQLPEAYIIPAEWEDVIDRIKMHGINVTEIKKELEVEVHTYKFRDAEWSKRPYESRHTVTFEIEPNVEQRTFSPGSIVIDMNQRAAKVAVNILEPKAPDSYVYWGFFDAIFERKEYVESYVMEERARMMLATDSSLRKEFETKLASDSSFVNNPRAILMWFYQKSPYWDKKKDVYPVGKIVDRKVLNNLLDRNKN